jgi:hypothetical protein
MSFVRDVSEEEVCYIPDGKFSRKDMTDGYCKEREIFLNNAMLIVNKF